jgi:hypothetical protein
MRDLDKLQEDINWLDTEIYIASKEMQKADLNWLEFHNLEAKYDYLCRVKENIEKFLEQEGVTI